MQEAQRIFKEVNDEEYEDLQDKRRNDDFIVDDDGFGYRDHGGEMWEVDEEQEDKQKKRRKLDKNEQMITEFMGPQSLLAKKSNLNLKPKNALPKVSAEQSKDIMQDLLKQLDDKEDLEDVRERDYLAEANKPVSFNKEEQLYNKYNLTIDPRESLASVTTEKANPVGAVKTAHNQFSKKRPIDQISNSASTVKHQATPVAPSNNTSYFDAKSSNSAQQDVSMSDSNYHSAMDDSKMSVTSSLPKPMEVDEDWNRVKKQNDSANFD